MRSKKRTAFLMTFFLFFPLYRCSSVFIGGSIAFFAFSVASPVFAQDAKSLFDKAEDYLKQKKYKEAKQVLNQLVAKHPMEDVIPKARLLLANLQEDFAVSTAQFRILATEYNDRPEGAEAQKNLGARYYLADKYTDAAESYQEFIQNHPKSPELPEVRYWYAACLSALDKNKEAIEEYKRVLEKSPDSPWAPKALLGMGNAHFKSQNYQEAEKQYLKTLDQYPMYEELNLVYFKLGQTYEIMRKPREAHASYRTLFEKYPKSLEVGEAKKRVKELEMAHPDLPRTAEEPTPVVAMIEPTPLRQGFGGQAPVPPPTAASLKPFHVQVGVYSKKANVDKARKLIKKAGYSSFVVTAKREGIPYTYFKVRVGNFAGRPEAERVAQDLVKKTREKAIVVED
jgi:TolA-binding protein